MNRDHERLVALEERFSWLQRLADELSAQLAAQDRRIMDLERQLRVLSDRDAQTGLDEPAP